MTEQPEAPGSGEATVSAARGAEQILQDPLVAGAVAHVREAVLDAREGAGEVTLDVDAARIHEVCESFKRNGFTYLVDLTAVDYSTYPGRTGDSRFAVVYHLYSFDRNDRVRLKAYVAEGATVPSVTTVWKAANWFEREIWDMFGIEFAGHPNLERILMWEGFNGHPLRKDFPVRGIDTGARIYPEVFPAGGGPKPGSTGKNAADVNLYQGEWTAYGTAPVTQPAPPPKKAIAAPAAPATAAQKPPAGQPPPPAGVGQPPPAAGATEPPAGAAEPSAAPVAQPAETPAAPIAVTGASEDLPWHNENLTLAERMPLAAGRGLKNELFAAMAQTDCGACGWDCEGYAAALESGETSDITLCVPGETETEDELARLMKSAGS